MTIHERFGMAFVLAFTLACFLGAIYYGDMVFLGIGFFYLIVSGVILRMFKQDKN